MSNNKIIVIVGATATKKSYLANKLATDLKLEVINADAFQVYKEINIGINKPSLKDLKNIKYHFINHKSIFDEYNIKIFQKEFFNLLKKNCNKNYILCGGSNLYIDSVINNYNLIEFQKEITFKDNDNNSLWKKLFELDPNEANKINLNNTKRLKQALKIVLSSKLPKSIKDKNNFQCPFKFIIICADMDRKILYEKINKRTIDMINNNWKNEVCNLLNQYGNSILKTNAFKAIGYQQIYESITQNKEIDINLIQKKTRNYAKRQLTWIRNKFHINHYYYFLKNNYQEIFWYCEQFLNEK